MTAYVVVEIQIVDPQVYKEVLLRTPATVAAYGGRYLARGGQTSVLAGTWAPERLVILEFESAARAKAWQESPEYAPIKALRQRSAEVNMVVIEGLPG